MSLSFCFSGLYFWAIFNDIIQCNRLRVVRDEEVKTAQKRLRGTDDENEA